VKIFELHSFRMTSKSVCMFIFHWATTVLLNAGENLVKAYTEAGGHGACGMLSDDDV
jgi:hypothetical protein